MAVAGVQRVVLSGHDYLFAHPAVPAGKRCLSWHAVLELGLHYQPYFPQAGESGHLGLSGWECVVDRLNNDVCRAHRGWLVLYLEEYAADSRWKRLVQLNIANLAGVPSIVYGLLGLGIFVWALNLGRSVLAGSLTLTLVVLPIVILASQEALRAVPGSIRQASFALGATRWQTTWRQVLPAAMPGIMTGVILAISRALGEAAPLVAMGAVQYVDRAPTSPWDAYSALPLVIFEWAGRPQAEFRDLSAAAILVLLVLLVSLNMIAAFVRYRFGKQVRW